MDPQSSWATNTLILRDMEENVTVYITVDGEIGIDVNGEEIIRKPSYWHSLALKANESKACEQLTQVGLLSNGSAPRDPQWEYTNYLHLLTEVQKAGVDVTAEIKDTVAELHKLIFKP